ncbi:transketolase C-terminal domain-containing protein [Micromonospora sp. DT227]|uniref:transketolase C-terminal domain-containing protein n=1 Tax=Micromonospora sp. DT227 TaxID=3393433 RepID=UPI003CF71DAB
MPRPTRVVDGLNAALEAVLARHPEAYLLGEDIADPYGGAFGVTRGLSSRYPDRVLTTPISEGAIVGAAAGLALAGDIAIVEIMFGDFAALAFDNLVNFASKSVSMYGRRVPIRLVVRCPTGGNRGYGPTHSQSLQKHFLGVPELSVLEASPFHDATAVFEAMLARGGPCVFFEDKSLYAGPVHHEGRVDDLFRYEMAGSAPGTALVAVDGLTDPDCLIIAPGGMSARALAAARSLLMEEDIVCQLAVPAQLYPFDVGPVLPAVRAADLVCVVEESTAGGTWGAEVAHQVYSREWATLRRPVRLVHSLDSVIPSASHLEAAVLVQAADIHRVIAQELS